MRIGIVEICEPNHYTAVLALARTYSVNPGNELVLFIVPALLPLLKEIASDVKIVVLEPEQNVQRFLLEVATYSVDRIHINTISKYYQEFAQTPWPNNIYFTVHNVDLWYDNSIFKRWRTLAFDYQSLLSSKTKTKLSQPLILFVKDFWRQYYRNSFIRRISARNYRIIVYSHSQKQHLTKYLPSNYIITFPFCVHTSYVDLSIPDYFRICIPGSVSNLRRNYSGVFDMVRTRFERLKSRIIIDLLGYIPNDQRFLLEEIRSLQSDGFNLIYNEGFIEPDEFDERLRSCDVILGNLKVQMNVFRKYGETKETGVIFNIIKSGKPGIMPGSYPVDEDVKDACLFFSNYDQLAATIIDLASDIDKLSALKLRARQAVLRYHPESLSQLLDA